jgi:hypothetical protein
VKREDPAVARWRCAGPRGSGPVAANQVGARGQAPLGHANSRADSPGPLAPGHRPQGDSLAVAGTGWRVVTTRRRLPTRCLNAHGRSTVRPTTSATTRAAPSHSQTRAPPTSHRGCRTRIEARPPAPPPSPRVAPWRLPARTATASRCWALVRSHEYPVVSKPHQTPRVSCRLTQCKNL